MIVEKLVKAAAKACDVTITDLAKETGIPRQTILAWQRRNRIPPASAALLRILKALGKKALKFAK